MSDFVADMLVDHATYWPPSSTDAYGQPSMGQPVEIKCRWETRNSQFIDENGDRALARAVVYTSIDVQPKGILIPARLSTVDQADPKANVG